ncbi:RNA polymerase Rpb1, domain 1-domain-containing protein [Endogone sp. FLAS-F59071]|nr:RNA polymerase Rpb1, domain 1-domain-containing protein [Endogone sp. FLAS-F59071]|eukprot:RUS21913.1 RNA polymerase Rpb1, domain 1-domain-containing protein [Endogone sp. FLAS-F59071]
MSQATAMSVIHATHNKIPPDSHYHSHSHFYTCTFPQTALPKSAIRESLLQNEGASVGERSKENVRVLPVRTSAHHSSLLNYSALILTVKHIQFGVLSPQDMVKLAEVEVTQRDLYNVADRSPVKHGVLDLRLGSSAKEGTCDTCGQPTKDCPGHFGYIKLVLPVFHIGYFRATINILQNICKACSHVMLEEIDRRTYLKRLRQPNLENMRRSKIVKEINDKCKKVVYCQYCGNTNGTVKKVGALKIVHEKFRAKRTHEEHEQFKKSFDMAVATIPELKTHLNKAQEDMNPLKVLKLFQQISSEDCELLGLDPQHGRPEQYVWQYLPVPPACIRPSVQQEGASGNKKSDHDHFYHKCKPDEAI